MTYNKTNDSELKIYTASNQKQNSYNTPYFLKFENGFEVKRIRKVLNELLNSDECFKTSFYLNQRGELEKSFNELGELLNINYYEKFTQRDKEEVLKDSLIQVTDSVLFRIVICKIEGSRADYIFLNFHHIIMDGYSISLFINEFIDLYYKKTFEKRSDKTRVGKNVRRESISLEKYPRFKRSLKMIKTDDTSCVISKSIDKNPGSFGSAFLEAEGAFTLALSEVLRLKDIYFAFPVLGRNQSNKNSYGNFTVLKPIYHDIEKISTYKELLKSTKKSVYPDILSPDNNLKEEISNIKKEFSGIFTDIIFDFKSSNLINYVVDPKHNIFLEEATGYTDDKFDFLFSIFSTEDQLLVEVHSKILEPSMVQNLINNFEKYYREISIKPENRV